MVQYFFVLGKNPTLSTAEIISVLNKLNTLFNIKTLSEEILTVSTDKELSISDLMQDLGGTIKLGKIFDEVGFNEDEQKFEKIFLADNLINNYFPNINGKVHFGISIYNGGGDKNYLTKITNKLKVLNITTKENLQTAGVKAGFVRIKERTLSSVSVAKNKLLNKGAEIILILTKDKILAGKTLAVQEFESFSFRDYGRPQRDKRSGIIPPKLARMMINLSRAPKEGLLLDPFCGSGTILQEAIILGYKNIIGSDISQNAISNTKNNIEWLFTHFHNINKSSFNIDIFSSDIRDIAAQVKPNSLDAIVTEPYLGLPLFKTPDTKTVQKIVAEVTPLYLAAFETFSRILKTTGKVVFLMPVFEVSGKKHFVEIVGMIKELGFLQQDFLPVKMRENPILQLTPRGTIIYGGREQFVKREITSWRKV